MEQGETEEELREGSATAGGIFAARNDTPAREANHVTGPKPPQQSFSAGLTVQLGNLSRRMKAPLLPWFWIVSEWCHALASVGKRAPGDPRYRENSDRRAGQKSRARRGPWELHE